MDGDDAFYQMPASSSGRSFSDTTSAVRARREREDAGYVPTMSEVRFEDIETRARAGAHEAALKLIDALKRKSVFDPKHPLQVATAESLTAGLIFSTLVDVPFGGAHKYGCFSVYDTDAKRVFLGVTALDVYTLECAAQMAVGVLRNSNASLAIAVSGNAMPNQGTRTTANELQRLGEVFISVAGYVPQRDPPHHPAIFVRTRVYNFCEAQYGGAGLANVWMRVVHEESELAHYLDATPEGAAFREANVPRLTDGFNEFLLTSHIASFIRHQTVRQACDDASEFLNAYNPIVPDFIQKIDSNPGAIQHMQAASGGSGVNNVALGQARAEALSTLPIVHVQNNGTHGRQHTGGTRLFTPSWSDVT